MSSAYVYMLRCADGSYYVGLTHRTPEERLGEHNAGIHDGYTSARRPVAMVWCDEFPVIADAVAFERQLKGWTRRKKEALIAGDYHLLPELARRGSATHGPHPEEARSAVSKEEQRASAGPAQPLTPDEFAATCDVSRETLARLHTYLDLLREWQGRKNLVAPTTLEDPWRRHMLDSAQLVPLIEPDAEIVDIGSGAGFPGLVLAIMGLQNVRLVESDRRKCEFLQAAAAATGTSVEIYPERAETLGKEALRGVADVVTARAVAPLPKLLGWAAPLLVPGGYCLFLKGARAEEELTAAGKDWRMRVTRFPSRSDPSGTVLRLDQPRRAAQRR